MRKTLLTLFVIAASSCGQEPTQTTKFRTSIEAEGAAPQRAFLVGLDDPEVKHQFDQMAVAGNFLYFNIPWYGVYRMAKYGGDVYPIEEANGIENFRGVAANGTDVYWVCQSSFGSAGPDAPHSRLRRQALEGGPLQTVAEGDISIDDQWYAGGWAFHASADAVYGAVQYSQKEYVDLTRFPVDGGASTVLWRMQVDRDSGPPPYSNLVSDQDFSYVTSCDDRGTTGCVLTRIDLRTGASDTLATTAETQQVVAVDGTDLYFVTAHQLLRRDKDGRGEPTVLVTFGEHQGATYMALVDDDDVYLIANGGALVAVPKAGGPLRTLATGLNWANLLVQDERNIFVMYHLDSIDVIPKSSVAPTP